MLSKSDYERTIATFLVELNHLCAEESDDHLRGLPKLAPEIDGYLADLGDSASGPATVLRWAFAYVDTYCGANWRQVIDAGYDAYLLARGNSNSS
jgi:hypothetical protein